MNNQEYYAQQEAEGSNNDVRDSEERVFATQ